MSPSLGFYAARTREYTSANHRLVLANASVRFVRNAPPSMSISEEKLNIHCSPSGTSPHSENLPGRALILYHRVILLTTEDISLISLLVILLLAAIWADKFTSEALQNRLL